MYTSLRTCETHADSFAKNINEIICGTVLSFLVCKDCWEICLCSIYFIHKHKALNSMRGVLENWTCFISELFTIYLNISHIQNRYNKRSVCLREIKKSLLPIGKGRNILKALTLWLRKIKGDGERRCYKTKQNETKGNKTKQMTGMIHLLNKGVISKTTPYPRQHNAIQ